LVKDNEKKKDNLEEKITDFLMTFVEFFGYFIFGCIVVSVPILLSFLFLEVLPLLGYVLIYPIFFENLILTRFIFLYLISLIFIIITLLLLLFIFLSNSSWNKVKNFCLDFIRLPLIYFFDDLFESKEESKKIFKKDSLRGIYLESSKFFKVFKYTNKFKFICPECLKTVFLYEFNPTCPFCDENYQSSQHKIAPIIFDKCPNSKDKIQYISCPKCSNHIDLFASYQKEKLENNRYE